MKAIRIQSKPQLQIQPFGDDVGTIHVLNQPLADLQRTVLAQVDVEVVDEVPMEEPYIFFGEQTWFSKALIQQMLDNPCSTTSGRVRCGDELWNEHMTTVAGDRSGRYILGVHIGPLPDSMDELPDWTFDWNLKDGNALDLHPKMSHALRPIKAGAIMAFEIHHWSDIVRVNQLAILERVESVKWLWRRMSIVSKFWLILKTMFKVRSFNHQTVARRIGTLGSNCKIHPTAVIEACEIGDNVEIGPYAVVRASVIGDGAKIEEHATVNLSVLGPKSRAARYAMVNLCVLMEEAFLSRCGGSQMCIFGRSSFVAVDAVMLDLSFGRTIRVKDNDGEWLDTRQHFLGVCIGHRAAIGNAVRLNYGVGVPNDALLVANADELITDATDAEPNIPCRVNDVHGVSSIRQKS